MLIAWTDKMVPVMNYTEIPPAMVAVKILENFEERKSRRLTGKN